MRHRSVGRILGPTVLFGSTVLLIGETTAAASSHAAVLAASPVSALARGLAQASMALGFMGLTAPWTLRVATWRVRAAWTAAPTARVAQPNPFSPIDRYENGIRRLQAGRADLAFQEWSYAFRRDEALLVVFLKDPRLSRWLATPQALDFVRGEAAAYTHRTLSGYA